MISKRHLLSNRLAYASIRSFGAPGGGSPHKFTHSNATNTTLKHPNEVDVAHHHANRFNFNDQFLYWISGRFNFPAYHDKLKNDHFDTYSGYNFW